MKRCTECEAIDSRYHLATDKLFTMTSFHTSRNTGSRPEKSGVFTFRYGVCRVLHKNPAPESEWLNDRTRSLSTVSNRPILHRVGSTQVIGLAEHCSFLMHSRVKIQAWFVRSTESRPSADIDRVIGVSTAIAEASVKRERCESHGRVIKEFACSPTCSTKQARPPSTTPRPGRQEPPSFGRDRQWSRQFFEVNVWV